MLYKWITTILTAVCCATCFAQQAVNNIEDSTVFKKATAAFALAFKNADSAILLASEALEESKRTKNEKAAANAYNSIGWAYMHKGHLDSAVIFLQRSKQLFTAAKSTYDIIRVDINLAEVYTKQNRIADAIQYLLQGDSLSNSIHHIPLQTDVKRQLAIVYREAGDQQKSAVYFNEALQGFANQGDYVRYVNTGVSLSILYRNMKLFDSSLSILNRCLKIATEKKGTPYQLAMTEENIAETYFNIDNFTEAFKHYTRAYNTFQKINNRADLAFEAFSMGKTLAKLKRPSEAEQYLLQSFHINDSLKMINYQADASLELASLYSTTGNWQKAYQYLQKATELKDRLNISSQVEKATELKEKFETEKKEQQIRLLKTQNQLTLAGNRKTRLVQYIFILLFAAAVVIGWLLFNRLKINKRLKEQLLRNQIAGDLHDDIGSALSSIDISSRIALLQKNNPAGVEEQLNRIRHQARKTMDSMSDIVWSINPHYDNFESMLARMKEFAADICEPQQVALQFNVEKEVELVPFDSDKRKNIFLVFKEAVNNAVKYSGCNLLLISFAKTTAGEFIMSIRDDGSGFSEDHIKKGNGLRNMKTRAEQLGGQLSVQPGIENGTLVELKCPA